MDKHITGGLLLGDGRTAAGTATVFAVDPSTGSTIQPAFVLANEADVDHACKLAAGAFDEFRSTDLETRARFLETIATNLEAIREALLARAIAETGLPVSRLAGEFSRQVNQLRLFARVVREADWLDLRVDPAMPDRQPFARPDIRLRQIAIGPVAVFGSSNFPLAFSVAGGDTASAFAAGCPVVVKGHLAHLGTGELAGQCVAAAVQSCGLPAGVFSLLPGDNKTGAALVAHAAIKAVGFTGSRAGGVALSAIAAARPEPIPVYAEMSSVNPVFLLPGALASRGQQIARSFAESMTVGAGQLCTNPGLLVAMEGRDLEGFISIAAGVLSGQEGGPMLTAGIHEAFHRGVGARLDNPVVRVIAKGKDAPGANRSPPVFFAVSAADFASDPSLADEVFGATSLLVVCGTVEEMIAVAEGLEGQLTGTLHIDDGDMDFARSLMPILERKAGRILVNGWPTGVEVSSAMVHGGPFPATSDSRTTSVGTMAIRRFLRPVSYQNVPDDLLPPELRDGGIRELPHLVDGRRL